VTKLHLKVAKDLRPAGRTFRAALASDSSLYSWRSAGAQTNGRRFVIPQRRPWR